MSRGRHRQSPPLHRLLVPVTIGAAAVACATGVWLVDGGFSHLDATTLVVRGLTTGVAVVAVVGAVLMRRWDRHAGHRLGEVKAARARDDWKTEERVAELEAELEQARELRAAVETRLREKRGELAELRTEHAALLRRYATAETERASALEGRRLLAIEAAEPTKALPAVATDHRAPSGAPTALTYLQADQALERISRNAARQREAQVVEGPAAPGAESPGAAPGSAWAPPSPAPPSPAPPSPVPASPVPAAPLAPAAGRPWERQGLEPVSPERRYGGSGRPAPLQAPRSSARTGAASQPASPRSQSAPPGGFDFFGSTTDSGGAQQGRTDQRPQPGGDADAATGGEDDPAPAVRPVPRGPAGKVIDLGTLSVTEGGESLSPARAEKREKREDEPRSGDGAATSRRRRAEALRRAIS